MSQGYTPEKKFMKLAIAQAEYGNKKFGKYPMGAVVVKNGKVISSSFNGLPENLDPTAHAEILAIKKASVKLKSRYLDDCILYTTNEPCAMCSGAAVWANMKGIVFGADVKDLENFWKDRRDKKKSSRKFIFVSSDKIINKSTPRMILIKKFMRKECMKLFRLYDPNLRR
jgi:tRNA(Arg) A34 adenosine deaminase TadA